MAQWRHRFLGFSVASAYWPGLLSAPFVPRWAAIAVLVPALCSLNIKALPGFVLGGLLFFSGWISLGLLYSPDPLSGMHEAMMLGILGMALLAGADMDDLTPVFQGLGAGLGISAIIAVAQRVGLETGVPQTSGAPGGLFFNSEVMAEFAALVLVWGVFKRAWWVASLALVPLLMADSRIAWLCLIVAVCAVLFAQRRYWLLGALILSALAAGVAMLYLLGDFKLWTAGHRITLWLMAVMAIEPMGQGLGWFQAVFPHDRFAHSDMLQFFAEVGLGALGLLVIPYAIWRRLGTADLAAVGVFAAVCFQAAVSFPLHFPATGFVAALVAGHLVGVRSVVCMGKPNGGIENGDGIRWKTKAGMVS